MRATVVSYIQFVFLDGKRDRDVSFQFLYNERRRVQASLGAAVLVRKQSWRFLLLKKPSNKNEDAFTVG